MAQQSHLRVVSTRIFYLEQSLLEQGGLVPEDDTGQMDVLPR
ncbi:MAG: hypothetical protein ABWY51_04285 [Gaiellaceae bacterium]